MSTVHDALQALTDLTPGRQQILTDVVAGLSRTPRQLPSKYFYDARGSRLFEQITQTCEYYPTRTELALLARVLPDIARSVGPHVHVVELGSGSGRKTALLLAAGGEVGQRLQRVVHGAHVRSLARRSPENCQRAGGMKKLR